MMAIKPDRVKFFCFFLCLLSLLIFSAGCAPKKNPAPPLDDQDLAGDQDPILGENGEEITPEEIFDMKRLGRHYRPLTPQEQAALETPTEMDFQLDKEDNEEIQRYFEFFTQEKRELFAKWLRRAQIYLPYVRDVLDQYGLPHDLAVLPFIESGYSPRAISKAKAGGMWQFMVGTSSRYGLITDSWVDQRFDPYLATHAAAKYLKELYAMFGDWYLALAAYNAGEAKIAKALEQTGAGGFNELVEQNHKLGRRAQLRRETKNYVPQFLAALKIVRNLEPLGFEPLNWNAAPPFIDLEIPKGTDLMSLAKSCDMNWEQFATYNPAFTRMTSSPISSGVAHIPPDTREAALAYLASPQAKNMAEYRKWKVRRGDTLKLLARKFGVSAASIQSANHLKSPKLSPGHELLIPTKSGIKNLPPVMDTLADASDLSAKSGKKSKFPLQDVPDETPKGKKTRKGKAAKPDPDDAADAPKVSVKGQSKDQAKDQSKSLSKAGAKAGAKDKTKAKARQEYVIREGDTMYSLAKKANVPVETLLADNGMKPGAALKIGQTISLPGSPEKEAKGAKSKSSKSAKGKDKSKDTAKGKGKGKDSAQDKKGQGKDVGLVRYQVRKGDTLGKIASKNGVSPEAIKQWNKLGSQDLQPGTTLKIYR